MNLIKVIGIYLCLQPLLLAYLSKVFKSDILIILSAMSLWGFLPGGFMIIYG